MKKQRLREVYVAWQHWSVGNLDIQPKSAWIWGLALSHCAVCTPTPICVSPSIFTSASHNDIPTVWIFKHPSIETVPPGKLERGYYPQATRKGEIKAQRGRATHTANPSSSEHPQDTVPHWLWLCSPQRSWPFRTCFHKPLPHWTCDHQSWVFPRCFPPVCVSRATGALLIIRSWRLRRKICQSVTGH